MKLKTTAGLAALCVALFGATAAAQAQSYNRLVVFGDSLSDNGNLPPSPGTPPSPPYYSTPGVPFQNVRFSNGPVWTELLGFTLARAGQPATGSIDLAFGGARSDNQASPPGLQVQLGMFTGSGGAYHSGDLVTVWAGANDLFQGFGPASTAASPTGAIAATATTAANNVGGAVNTIAGTNGVTVLVGNMPALQTTPAFAGGPAVPLATVGSNTFNSVLFANLQGIAAAHPGSNVIYFDTAGFLTYAQGHAGLFGLSNVTQSCFNGVTVCATPDSYLFWDSVHPTAAGHRMLAKLATDYLYYGDFGAVTATEAEAGLRHRDQTFDTALDMVQSRSFEGQASGVAMIVDYDSASVDARGLVPSTDERATSVRVALAGAISPNARVGALFSGTQGDVKASGFQFSDESWSADLYAGWRSGSWFVNGVAGVGLDTYRDIRRTLTINPIVNDGRTNGWTAGAKVQAGTWFDFGAWAVSPRAAVAYSRGMVNGYTEDGPLVRYQYEDRGVNAASLEGTVRVEGPLGDRVKAYAEAGYRGYVSYDGDPVVTSLADNTASPLSRSVAKPVDGLGLIDAGVTGKLTEKLSLGVSYRGRFGDSASSNMGMVRLNLSF